MRHFPTEHIKNLSAPYSALSALPVCVETRGNGGRGGRGGVHLRSLPAKVPPPAPRVGHLTWHLPALGAGLRREEDWAAPADVLWRRQARSCGRRRTRPTLPRSRLRSGRRTSSPLRRPPWPSPAVSSSATAATGLTYVCKPQMTFAAPKTAESCAETDIWPAESPNFRPAACGLWHARGLPPRVGPACGARRTGQHPQTSCDGGKRGAAAGGAHDPHCRCRG